MSTPRKLLSILLGFASLCGVARAQLVSTVPTDPLFEPYGVAVDNANGDYYISDGSNSRLLKFSPATGETSILLGSVTPEGIAVTDRAGLGRVLVFADTDAHTIRYYRLDGGGSGVLAGKTGVHGRANNATGVDALFFSPAGITAQADGTIYVADLQNSLVRRIGAEASAPVTTVAAAESFSRPAAVAVTGSRLFVADTGNNSVKEFDLANGDLLKAEITGFEGPRGLLWVGGSTGLLVSDTGNSVIRFVLGRTGATKSVLIGESGTPGSANGAPTVARLSEPVGLALDNNGDLLIADLKNNVLRKFTRNQAQAPEVAPGTSFSTNLVTVVAKQSVPVTTPGSVFRYTTDGSDPTPASAIFPSSPAGLDLNGGPVPLKLRAFNPDFSASTIVSNNYTFGVDPILFTVPGGKFSNDVSVAISTATESAQISFTSGLGNSAFPTASSPVWTDRTLSGTSTLIARGYKGNYKDSAVVSNTFEFFVDPITLSPAGGNFANDVPIVASTKTASAVIRYTIDPEVDPTESSPVWTTKSSVPAGKLRLRAFRPGYTPSPVVVSDFNFTVSDPVLSPAALSTNAPFVVTVKCATTNAHFSYIVVDESSDVDPSPTFGTIVDSLSSGVRINITNNGIFKVIAFRDEIGYVSSKVVSAKFDLKVATPTIVASAISSDNSITLTLGTVTPGATFYYSFDNNSPTAAGHLSVVADSAGKAEIKLDRTGKFNLVAVRPGFVNSEMVSSAFTLKAATPQIRLYTAQNSGALTASSTNINVIYFDLSTPTSNTNKVLYYTLDGSSPVTSVTKQMFTTNYVRLDTNATVKVTARVNDANLNVYDDSDVASLDVFIQADAPVMTPPRGFFQDGTELTLAVQRGSGFSTPSRIYYTLDGTEPTVDSLLYTSPIKLNGVSAPSPDLRGVRSRAFADGILPSLLTAGSLATNNTIGIAKPAKGGVGAKLVLPVVVGLKQNDQLRSLQYRVQVWPKAGAPNLSISGLDGISTTTNDFIVTTGSQSGVNTTNEVRRSQTGGPVLTNELVMSFVGAGSHLLLKDYSTVNLLQVNIPKTAKVGDVYGIRILEATGTTNAAQGTLKLVSAPDQTITIENIPYLVGDSSPGVWYNSGDFGDGNLDNADVNNAFYASLGLHVPYRFSDVFNSMDSFPLDEDGFAGGDGQIRLLDWQIILLRSLRLDPLNWERSWDTNGLLDTVSVPLAPSSSFASHGHVTASGLLDGPAVDWFRHALIEAESVTNAQAGSAVSLPVYLDIKPGRTITTLQFLAEVKATRGAVVSPVTFALADGLPSGITVDGLPATQVGHAWSVDSGLSLTGRSLIGFIRFVVPQDAAQGDCFTVRFLNVDGAPSIRIQYDLESIAGCVWVGTAGTNAFGRLPDEWRSHFFGSLSNVLSKPDGDADGDGVSNWEEYVRGSNPAKLRFQVQQAVTEQFKPGFKIRWLALAGKQYVIECSATPDGPWIKIAQGVIGDGSIKEVIDSSTLDKTKFYRLRGE